jgi:L-asparaginase II
VTAPVLVELRRGEVVESRHRGSLVVLAPGGTTLWQCGDPDAALLPRSAAKPLQAAALLESGASATPEHLALAAASHSGEQMHMAVVRQMLDTAGLTEAALQTPADLPLGETARRDWLAAGMAPSPIAMNCSGKHAAMLQACVANGWTTNDYLRPTHRVQEQILGRLTDWSGGSVQPATVDGCGAVLACMTLRGLATALQRLTELDVGQQVLAAMQAHPELVGGTGREATRLMRSSAGLVVKDGAEAVWVSVLPDSSVAAVKIDDGAWRAGAVAIAAAIDRLVGLPDEVADLMSAPVLGGGRPVGALTAVGVRF